MTLPFLGRMASLSSTRWNIVKMLLQTVVIWMVTLVILPASIYWMETVVELSRYRFDAQVWRWCGGLLFVSCGALCLLSGIVLARHGHGTPLPMDSTRTLVVQGPYRYARNPMAISGVLMGIAVGLYFGSPCIVAYALCALPVWQFLIRPWEERDLERRFGAPYRHYRQRVRCWRPRLHPYNHRALRE